MSKSEEMLRLERDLTEQTELGKKLDAEIKRIAAAGEAECDGEAMVKAAAALGYTITMEELERSAADLEMLEDDELEAAGGAGIRRPPQRQPNQSSTMKPAEDDKGHDSLCYRTWHCFINFLHTETKSENVACWANYFCIAISAETVYDRLKQL